MDKLIAYFANHPEGIRAALALDSDGLRAPDAGRIYGWNLVASFRGEPLVRSRPNEPRELTDVREVFDGVRTDSALIALREGSRSADSLDEGGPFRFGWWSCVVVGRAGARSRGSRGDPRAIVGVSRAALGSAQRRARRVRAVSFAGARADRPR